MKISVVSGTYNRLSSLQRMIASARASRPPSIPLDFIIIDGGSTDGTLDWCFTQPDITLIQHGELRGAIKAFTEGAYAATGDYVVMANDDIAFIGDSILKALIHLETHPTCGGVAFMDNRPFPDVPKGQFKAQLQPAFRPDGEPTQVVYAQIGMFRKWLGDKVDWWGASHPVMSQARTYGGDNFLSSELWRLGYSVDTVTDVRVYDYVMMDHLRRLNDDIKDNAFYTLYPRGPQLAATPQVENRQGEQLRILYLPVFEPMNGAQRLNKRGLREALSDIGIVYELDYLNMHVNLAAVVETFQPHIMLTQVHDAKDLSPLTLADCRRRRPSMLIVNWNGDARGLTDPDYMAWLRNVDLQLVLNAAALPGYAEKGIRAAYWQIGYEEPSTPLPDVMEHDVVFLGNCYSPERQALEAVLVRLTEGKEYISFGLYGMGWKYASGNTLYDFAAGEAIYKHCKIAISDTFPDTVGFVSNRLFQALAAGAFVLQQHIPDFEQWTGLKAGVHYIEWESVEHIPGKVHYWLRHPEKRAQIAAAGQAFVREHFSFPAQVRKLFLEILPKLEGIHV